MVQFFVKSDSGIGYNYKSVNAIKFQHKMYLKNACQMPGLWKLNALSQESDNLFSGFKASADNKADETFERKTFDCVTVLKERKKSLTSSF